jgi:endonuclease/exonuclease/phosphatase family metal-dependent hydrolase
MNKRCRTFLFRYLLIPVLGVNLLASSCGRREKKLLDESPLAVIPRGQEETLEIVTWNIENFPLAGETTVRAVRQIIESLNVDLFAVQEISDTAAFRQLLIDLEEYEGLYSADDYGEWYQKSGVIYREGLITIEDVGQIFINDSYAFPRPPLEMTVVAQKDGKMFDFRLIVIHLKAGADSDDLRRRREAAEKLKEYIDSQVASSAEKDFVVAGDWNDRIDDPQSGNAFTVFIEDSLNYLFLTRSLTEDPNFVSYPLYSSLIDHILISRNALEEYMGGETTTLRLDEEVYNYLQEVSDHRPVMAKFPVF